MDTCQSPNPKVVLTEKRFAYIEIDERTIAGRITYARRQANLYQRELAAAMHVTGAVISHLEKGHREPYASEIIKISKITGCTLGYLMTGDKSDTEKAMNINPKHSLPIDVKVLQWFNQ